MAESNAGSLREDRALILAGGDLDPGGDEGQLLQGPWRHVICADGGARHARALGLRPTLLIGDMDSIDPGTRLVYRDVPTLDLPEAQHKTDSQLAVEWALEHGAGFIVIAGGLGSRFDHSLANAHLLAYLDRRGATGVVTDGRQAVYLLARELTLPGPPGRLVSVIPLGDVRGLRLKGLRWELDGIDLVVGETRTISNEFTGKAAHFALAAGMALVVTGPLKREEISSGRVQGS